MSSCHEERRGEYIHQSIFLLSRKTRPKAYNSGTKVPWVGYDMRQEAIAKAGDHLFAHQFFARRQRSLQSLCDDSLHSDLTCSAVTQRYRLTEIG